MNKKLLIAVVTLCLASAAYATQNVLIGDFEETGDGWYDVSTGKPIDEIIYPPFPPDLPDTKYEYDYSWHTHGNCSLMADWEGWGWSIRRDIHTDFWDNYQIEFDIYAVAQDGSSATWAQVEKLAGSTETNGWFDMPEASFSIGLGGSATHCVFDYSAYKTSEYASPTDTYGSIIFAYNADAPVYLYIDNIWLTVPEPATLALLGFGGLALLRRRK
jgi:hypothetical protein